MTILMFGATGAAGGSVLAVCLAAPEVAEVRAIVRRDPGVTHPKLRVIIHADFLRYEQIAGAFTGVDACLYCLGISVSQVTSEQYRVITYDYAMAAARMLKAHSPGAAFHFISGASTSLTSRFRWARVKAETERDLTPLVGAVCWRPASIDGADSASSPRLYQWVRPLFRLLRPFRSLYITGEDIGHAMLQATAEGVRRRTFENAEMRDWAARRRAALGT